MCAPIEWPEDPPVPCELSFNSLTVEPFTLPVEYGSTAGQRWFKITMDPDLYPNVFLETSLDNVTWNVPPTSQSQAIDDSKMMYVIQGYENAEPFEHWVRLSPVCPSEEEGVEDTFGDPITFYYLPPCPVPVDLAYEISSDEESQTFSFTMNVPLPYLVGATLDTWWRALPDSRS